jgi:type VI protein secretion system component VasK
LRNPPADPNAADRRNLAQRTREERDELAAIVRRQVDARLQQHDVRDHRHHPRIA